MSGLKKILSNVLKYHHEMRPAMAQRFEKLRERTEPKAVMFSCMDSRIIITRLMQCDPGDMFLVRNAGNFVPHHDALKMSPDSVGTEPGALELGCVMNNIPSVLVCGHSDCKAMNLLHSVRDKVLKSEDTPLTQWVKKRGFSSVLKYEEWKKRGTNTPISFQAEAPDKSFEAYIDPDNNFQETDKFSQINTLQQVENIASHPVLFEKLQKNEVQIHALWLDMYDGSFHMFSPTQKRFLQVSKENFDSLTEQL